MVDVVIARDHSFYRRRSSKLAEPLAGDRGTTLVLPIFMSATATIEEINGEQIATRTDLLLMRARAARSRLSSNKLAFANDVARLRAARAITDRTLMIRVRRAGSSTTTAAVLATVFAVAIAITSFL